MEEHPFRSARLLYRAVEDTPEDSDFVHSIHTDPFAYGNSNFSILRPQSKKNSIEGFKRYLESNLISVIICLPASETDANPQPTPIGAMSLSQLAPRHAHHRDSSIGLDIVKAYQGKGYGTEAVRWLMWWGFTIAGLHRLTIEAFEYNETATHMYPKLGFVPEGRKRKSVWFNGKWWDGLTYGMLEEEWKEKQKQIQDGTST